MISKSLENITNNQPTKIENQKSEKTSETLIMSNPYNETRKLRVQA